MNRNYFLVSLLIHVLLWFALTTTRTQNEKPQVVQIGVEMNFSKALTHFEKKSQPKKPKAANNLSHNDPSHQKEETNNELENVNEKASGRDQSLMSLYASQIAKLIDDRKFYPLIAKKMKQEGEVILKISLNNEGHILNLEIEKSSIYPSLNTAALDCVKKIHSFPPIPLELGVDKLTFSIPIEFKIL